MRAWRGTVCHAAATVLLLAGALLVGFGSTPAAAHAVLEKTAPADGSTVQTTPASVSLTFDEAPEAKFSAIHVTDPNGQRKDNGPITVTGSVVSEILAGDLPAGRYVVDWRVISDDGHPVAGQFSFTAKSAASQFVARSADSDPAPATSSNTVWTVIAVVAAVIIIGGIVVLFTRRRRRPVVSDE